MNRTAFTLLLGLGLLLSACGGQPSSPSPSGDPSGTVSGGTSATALTTLSGKLVNWPGGTGTMSSQDFFSTPAAVLA